MRDIHNYHGLLGFVDPVDDAPIANSETQEVGKLAFQAFDVVVSPGIGLQLRETAIDPSLKWCIRALENLRSFGSNDESIHSILPLEILSRNTPPCLDIALSLSNAGSKAFLLQLRIFLFLAFQKRKQFRGKRQTIRTQ